MSHRICLRVAAAAAASLVAIAAMSQSAPRSAESRGELLYSTHCVACHTTQIHWRDKKLATDWNRLRAEVRRWQENGRLSWGEDEISDVTVYLNGLYYHYEPPAGRAALSAISAARTSVLGGEDDRERPRNILQALEQVHADVARLTL